MTGTVTAKARIANANEGLWPGQFVKAEVVLGVEPEARLGAGAGGPARPARSLRVRRQGRQCRRAPADRHQAHPGRRIGGRAAASKAGEQVVVDGQLRLVNGAAVVVPSRRPTEAPDSRPRRRAARRAIRHAFRALHPPPGDDHPGDGVVRHRRPLRLQAAARRRHPARRFPDHPGHARSFPAPARRRWPPRSPRSSSASSRPSPASRR